MIASYTNYDDRHHDDDYIVHKWRWSSSWYSSHCTRMMIIASYTNDDRRIIHKWWWLSSWWSSRCTQIMMVVMQMMIIASYTNYDDPHHDDDRYTNDDDCHHYDHPIIHKWWWSSSWWLLHHTRMMMIASYTNERWSSPSSWWSSSWWWLYPCSTKTREVLGNPSRRPRDFLRPEGGGNGFPNNSRVLLEHGHSLNLSVGSGSENPSLWTGKDWQC